MSKVIFNYFDGKVFGESARLLLAYGGQEFEDRRIKFSDWPALKDQMPFRKLPVLEIDGKKFSESIAIASYLGHKYGLAGNTLEEDLEIQQNLFFFNDLRAAAKKVHNEKDEAVKERKYEENLKNDYSFRLNKLDEIIKNNNGHFAAGKLTWADFVFAGMFEYIKLILRKPDLVKEYPSFQKVIDAVYNEPKVKAYTDSRPKFEFDI